MTEEVSGAGKEPVFPLQIISDPCYNHSMDLSHLCDLNVCLQRACCSSFDECCKDGNPDSVFPEAFGPIKTVKKMSVNLLGGYFVVGHERWSIKKPACDEWRGGEVNHLELQKVITFTDEAYPSVYFRYSIANSIKWTFPRTFPDQATFDKQRDKIIEEYEQGARFSKNETYHMKAHTSCLHVPTQMNYWHCEVHSFIEENPEDQDVDRDKGYRGMALRGMVEILRKECTLRVPKAEDIPRIPEALYLRL